MDNGGLHFHYQPQFNLFTGEIRGAEALLRLKHNNKILLPAEFLDQVDNHFLSKAWPALLNQLINFINFCHSNDRPLTVAFNVTPDQLLADFFLPYVDEALSKLACNAKFLEVELTEKVAAADHFTLLQRLGELKERGLSVVIDDFGAGYANLRYLSDLPIDGVKIDRHFIKGINTPVNEEILRFVIKVAKLTNFFVLAEGVEMSCEADKVKALGCDFVQGFYHGKPCSAAEFSKFFIANMRHQAAVSCA
ncbi:EAL domain-containing protein (putative c-di-GMP-specific phosphodiesterase class I) [Rheinheimera pacifica]|uniref:EAL domain-containing protein n=1 Tax=Rheinheimera pacifica TaxID=173990 RepID=UPI00216993EC|nr:EAL domain-containing protein [Rheinheimera pacifica]MCS4309520.1 EAL domain-containing protein (putative c-di-GMP-specific phosphodiesterase class I) [Rheinheimera pacifica]